MDVSITQILMIGIVLNSFTNFYDFFKHIFKSEKDSTQQKLRNMTGFFLMNITSKHPPVLPKNLKSNFLKSSLPIGTDITLNNIMDSTSSASELSIVSLSGKSSSALFVALNIQLTSLKE